MNARRQFVRGSILSAISTLYFFHVMVLCETLFPPQALLAYLIWLPYFGLLVGLFVMLHAVIKRKKGLSRLKTNRVETGSEKAENRE